MHNLARVVAKTSIFNNLFIFFLERLVVEDIKEGNLGLVGLFLFDLRAVSLLFLEEFLNVCQLLFNAVMAILCKSFGSKKCFAKRDGARWFFGLVPQPFPC